MHYHHSTEPSGMHEEFPGFDKQSTAACSASLQAELDRVMADLGDIDCVGADPLAGLDKTEAALLEEELRKFELMTEWNLIVADANAAPERREKAAHMMKIVSYCAEKTAKIKADNERLRAQRNALRNRAERDPSKYAQQKKRQRKEYSDMIMESQGRQVNAYVAIPGATRSEYELNKKLRAADRQWKSERRKLGWTDDQIDAGLAALHAKRQAKQQKNRASF